MVDAITCISEGLVQLAFERGIITDPNTPKLTRDIRGIRGKNVFGSLGLSRAAQAESVTLIHLDLCPDDRNKVFTLDELRERAGPTEKFKVREIPTRHFNMQRIALGEPIDLMVTKDPLLMEYALEIGVITTETDVWHFVTAEEVAGKNILGHLPLRVAAKARTVSLFTSHIDEFYFMHSEHSAERLRSERTGIRVFKVIQLPH